MSICLLSWLNRKLFVVLINKPINIGIGLLNIGNTFVGKLMRSAPLESLI